MSVSVTFASIAAPGFDEEVARAEIYGLLAQLYYAPPPSDLLAQLRAAPRQAPDQGGFRGLVAGAGCLRGRDGR